MTKYIRIGTSYQADEMSLEFSANDSKIIEEHWPDFMALFMQKFKPKQRLYRTKDGKFRSKKVN